MISQRSLRIYANDFLWKHYKLSLNVPLKINGRLSRTYGQVVYRIEDNKNKIESVELNKHFVQHNSFEVVLDVLRHELVHYALIILGKPHKDGQKYFEDELRRLGVVSQSTINRYEIKNKPKMYNKYTCINCDNVYHVRKKLQGDGSFHQCHCGGSLKYVGKLEI